MTELSERTVVYRKQEVRASRITHIPEFDLTEENFSGDVSEKLLQGLFCRRQPLLQNSSNPVPRTALQTPTFFCKPLLNRSDTFCSLEGLSEQEHDF